MANGLYIVPIGIKHEGAIVICMIVGAKSRRPVVNAAGGDAGGEESIDIRRQSGIESEVDARRHGNAFGYPEVTTRIGAGAMSNTDPKAGRLGTSMTKNIAKRPQSLGVKKFALFKVTDRDPHMVNHALPFLIAWLVP